MIYVGGRELSISLTKIEFVSISGLILCQGITPLLHYYILLCCLWSSEIKTVSGDINEGIPGYRSRCHIHYPDSPPGSPEMMVNIKV